MSKEGKEAIETTAIFIEGLAAVGRLARYWRESCEASQRERIYAEDVDGNLYRTNCIDKRAVKKIILALEDYKRLSSYILEEIDSKDKTQL